LTDVSIVFTFFIGSPHAVINLRFVVSFSFFCLYGMAFSNAVEITLVVEPVSTNAATTTVPTSIFIVNGLFIIILGESKHFFDEKCPYAIISVRIGYAWRPGRDTFLFPVVDAFYSQLLPYIFETSYRLSLCGLYFCKNNRFCRLCR
jgi:hypothetical protein